MSSAPEISIAADPVLQFSVFTPNRVGRLCDMIAQMHQRQIHVMAITVLDTTETAVVRFVVDDPEGTRAFLNEACLPFSESEILAVEMPSHSDLQKVLSALLEAEVNIHYVYSFILRPEGKAGLVLNVEDQEVAGQALHHRGFKVLTQRDISR